MYKAVTGSESTSHHLYARLKGYEQGCSESTNTCWSYCGEPTDQGQKWCWLINIDESWTTCDQDCSIEAGRGCAFDDMSEGGCGIG